MVSITVLMLMLLVLSPPRLQLLRSVCRLKGVKVNRILGTGNSFSVHSFIMTWIFSIDFYSFYFLRYYFFITYEVLVFIYEVLMLMYPQHFFYIIDLSVFIS